MVQTGVEAMDLKNLIKHHRYEFEHSKRLMARVAADFDLKAAKYLEDIERRFGEAIVAGD
jgi:hypothetical protein